jgi:hypothetical protein
MAKVKVGIDGKNGEELFAYSTTLITTIALPAGVAVYPTPEPSVAAFNLTHTALGAGVTLIANLEQELEAARNNLPKLVEDHAVNINARAGYVQTTSGGDPGKIPLSGFAVAAAPQPVGPLSAPESLTAVMSEHPGVIKTSCKTMAGVKSWLTECREHIDGTAWVQCSVGPRKSDNGGLTSGKYYAFRMAAVGAAGQSPWSAETVCMAP